jgi:hypothetical protein
MSTPSFDEALRDALRLIARRSAKARAGAKRALKQSDLIGALRSIAAALSDYDVVWSDEERAVLLRYINQEAVDREIKLRLSVREMIALYLASQRRQMTVSEYVRSAIEQYLLSGEETEVHPASDHPEDAAE